MKASVHANWCQSPGSFFWKILLPSAHLSAGANSALDWGEEGVALACWEPTFWFRSQEIHREQNLRMENHVLRRVSWKEILSHSQG